MREAITRNKDFTRATRLVGYFLADHINFRTGYAWPPQQLLAELAGVTTRTVHAACIALEGDNWFRRQLNGRNWIYIPNWDRLETPETISGVQCRKSGNDFSEHRKLSTSNTGSQLPPILSNRTSERELRRGSGQLPTPSALASNDEGSGSRESVAGGWRSSHDALRRARAKLKGAVIDDATTGVAMLPDQSDAITRQARRAGAPQFVFENSEPWRAWTAYRAAHGLGAMPTRQRMVAGRWRTGWDAPTLYPPGYSRKSEGGAA